MAAVSLPFPGTEYGACETACIHRDCEETRYMAAQVCRFCNGPVAYGLRFYIDNEQYTHMICLQKDIAEQRAQKGRSS